MIPKVIGATILVESIASLNASKFVLFAGSCYIVIDHINKDTAAEKTFFLEQAVNHIQLVPDCLLLLVRKLRLLGAFTTEARRTTALDLERSKHVFES